MRASDGVCRLNGTAARLAFGFHHTDRPMVRIWAVDAAGNVGQSVLLTWTVDSFIPTTLWPALSGLSQDPSPEILLSCTRSDCRFLFSLDRDGLALVGAGDGVSESVAVAAMASASITTPAALLSPRRTARGAVTIAVGVKRDGVPVAVELNGTATVEARLDGAVTWTDVRSMSGYDISTAVLQLTGFPDGNHTVQLRGRDSAVGWPVTITWTVDWEAPVPRFVSAPPAYDPVPRSSARFLVTADSQLGTSFHGQLFSCAAGMPPTCTVVTYWTDMPHGDLALDDLIPGTRYRLAVVATDAVGNAGPVQSWSWLSAPCLSRVQLTVTGLLATLVSYRVRVLSWAPVDNPGAITGYEFVVDDGSYVPVSAPYVVVRGVYPGVHHNVGVRAVPVEACAVDMGSLPISSVSWLEYDTPPGRPSIVVMPPLTSTSLFATFILNNTAPNDTFVYEYQVDAVSAWTACAAVLQLGPLAVGVHFLAVRSAATSGPVAYSIPVTYQWEVASLANSTLLLHNVGDGSHSLQVVATDAIGHMEVAPRTHHWTVDTQPPTTVAALLSPALTNAAVAVVGASCEGESHPELCTFCWRLSFSGIMSPPTCTSNTTLTIPSPANGVVGALITAVDGAGNRGEGVVVGWTADSTPPVTSITILTGQVGRTRQMFGC